MIKDYVNSKERLSLNKFKVTIYHDFLMVMAIILIITVYVLEGKLQ